MAQRCADSVRVGSSSSRPDCRGRRRPPAAAALARFPAVTRPRVGAGRAVLRPGVGSGPVGRCYGQAWGWRAYLARRTPVIAHFAPGGKKFLYVARVWPGGVIAAPPRSTCWPTMNFPLYSPTDPGAGTKPG